MINNKIINKLKHDIITFEKNIFSNRVIYHYPILPIQLIAILANYKSKIYEIKFNTYVDIDKLKGIILQVIRNHDLFRSSIISRGGKLFIQEHEPPEEIQIPVLDFSFKNDQEREKIINKVFKSKSIKKLGTKQFFIKFLAYRNLFLVLSHLYTNNKKYRFIHKLLSIPLFNEHNSSHKHALGKFILVKNNIKEYVLIMYLDHLLVDDVSIGHLIEEIEKPYYSDSYRTNKSLSYSSLAAQLSLVAEINDPDIIIDKLKLKDYFDSSQKIKNELSYSDYNLLRYNAIIKDLYRNELIEVSIFLSAIICSKIFKTNKVPITLLSGNRKYQNLNYYNTIGLFQDFVPLLVEIEKIDGKFNKNPIDHYLNFLSTNNINIMYIIFNKYNDKGWQNLIKLINPEKIIGSEPVITLNIEFDQENNDHVFNKKSNKDFAENNQISIIKTKDKVFINNLKKQGGIILWVNISENSINFKVESLFPIEEKYFNTFSEDIREFIVAS